MKIIGFVLLHELREINIILPERYRYDEEEIFRHDHPDDNRFSNVKREERDRYRAGTFESVERFQYGCSEENRLRTFPREECAFRYNVNGTIEKEKRYHDDRIVENRYRNIRMANLIATNSVLLERDRLSEELLDRAVEVALLKEKNDQLTKRLKYSNKENFDSRLANNNFRCLYEMF